MSAPDRLGPQLDAVPRLATFGFGDVARALGMCTLPMAFEADSFRLDLRDSLYEAYHRKPRTTVIAHE